MKRFNKSYELSVFLMLFVLVIAVIRGDMSNRIDAEQEPFENVILADDGGGPRSTLFGSCLARSKTLAAKFVSIKISETNEFIRYVPDSSQLTLSPEWTPVARTPVKSITDCAKAADSEGKPMFKYSGGADCKVSSRSYDLTYEPGCVANEEDAVFISSSAVVMCPLPSSIMLVHKENGTYFCVTVTIGPLSRSETETFCIEHGGASIYKGPFGLAGFDDVLKVLKDQKVESGNFTLDVTNDNSGTWQWNSGAGAVDLALMVSAPSMYADDIIFINGAAGGKLDFAPLATYMGGVVCVVQFTSP